MLEFRLIGIVKSETGSAVLVMDAKPSTSPIGLLFLRRCMTALPNTFRSYVISTVLHLAVIGSAPLSQSTSIYVSTCVVHLQCAVWSVSRGKYSTVLTRLPSTHFYSTARLPVCKISDVCNRLSCLLSLHSSIVNHFVLHNLFKKTLKMHTLE